MERFAWTASPIKKSSHFALCSRAALAQAQQPQILSSFDALAGDRNMSYKDHPDMALAACSNCGRAGQVLVATGMDIAVYDTVGKVLKRQTMREFIKAAGVEPDKINDHGLPTTVIKRWIVVCSCSADFLMVSGGSDATGSWKGIALTDATGDLTMFPGWDRNGVYISEFQRRELARDGAAGRRRGVERRQQYFARASRRVQFSEYMNCVRRSIRIPRRSRPTRSIWWPAAVRAKCHEPPDGPAGRSDHMVRQQATVNGPASIPPVSLQHADSYAQPSGPVRGRTSRTACLVYRRTAVICKCRSIRAMHIDCGSQGVDANNLFFWFDIDTANMSSTARRRSPPFAFVVVPDAASMGMATPYRSYGEFQFAASSVYLFTHVRFRRS